MAFPWLVLGGVLTPIDMQREASGGLLSLRKGSAGQKSMSLPTDRYSLRALALDARGEG